MRLNSVLNTKFKIRTSSNQGEFSINYEYLNNSDNYITTPNTTLIKDVIFKYEDKLSKVRQITDDINSKRTVDRIQYILAYFKKIQNYDNHFFTKLDNFNDSMKIISSYLLDNIKEILDKDIEIMYDEIKKVNSNLREYLRSFSRLDDPKITVNVDNLHDIFNPLFSGEFNLEEQFRRLLQNEVSTKLALNLLKKYIDSQFSQGEIISFYDLLRIKKILNNKYSYQTFIQNNCLITYDYDQIKEIDLTEFDYIVPKDRNQNQIMNRFVTRNINMNLSSHNFSTRNRRFYSSSTRRFSSSHKAKEFVEFTEDKDREKVVEENFSNYIKKAEELLKAAENKDDKVNETPTEQNEKVESTSTESKMNVEEKTGTEDNNFDFFSGGSSETKGKSKETVKKGRKDNRQFEQKNYTFSENPYDEEKRVDESTTKIFKNGIDLTLAAIIYNLEWWNKKVLFYENNELRKKSLQSILSDPILKDEIPSICFSLTHFKYELNSTLSNPELFLYDLFINPIREEGKEVKSKDKETIEEFISNHPLKFNLGYYGYMSLLKTAGFKKSKSGLKKVIQLMKSHKFLITDEFFTEIINICIENKFPITLYEIMTKFIEEGKLSKPVFIKYVLYLDTFKEFSKEIRETCLNIQNTLKIPLDFSIIEPFIIKQISSGRKRDISEMLKNFRANLEKNKDLEEFKNMTQEEWTSYLEENIYQSNYKTCLYMICSHNKTEMKKEMETIMKEIRSMRKKSKTPEWALINVLYSSFLSDVKSLPLYLNTLFSSKKIVLEDLEFDEIINLWTSGIINNDLTGWKKLLQVIENRNIIYSPKYIEKIISIYNKSNNPTELKVFLMAFDKETFKSYTYNQRNSLKQSIKEIFDYPTFKEIKDQLNSLYYEDRPKALRTMKVGEENKRRVSNFNFEEKNEKI